MNSFSSSAPKPQAIVKTASMVGYVNVVVRRIKRLKPTAKLLLNL
jgi:hypothetical protein